MTSAILSKRTRLARQLHPQASISWEWQNTKGLLWAKVINKFQGIKTDQTVERHGQCRFGERCHECSFPLIFSDFFFFQLKLR